MKTFFQYENLKWNKDCRETFRSELITNLPHFNRIVDENSDNTNT